MLFQPQLCRLILSGRKTQTRRLVKPGQAGAQPRCFYRVGSSYPLERPMRLDEADEFQAAVILKRRRGRPPKKEIGRLGIRAVEREPLGAITFDSARAEGFKTPTDFKAYWIRLHDKRWPKRTTSWCPDCLLDADWEPKAGPSTCATCDGTEEITLIPTVSDEECVARFDEHWADVEVWAITLEVQASTLYLADSVGRHGDYVTTERDSHGEQIAMTNDVATESLAPEPVAPGVPTWSHGELLSVPEEAVSPEVVAGWTKKSHSTHQQIKDRIHRNGETAAAQRDLDRRLLSLEDRICRARAAAKQSSRNITAELRAFEAAKERHSPSQTIEQRVRTVERAAGLEEVKHAA